MLYVMYAGRCSFSLQGYDAAQWRGLDMSLRLRV